MIVPSHVRRWHDDIVGVGLILRQTVRDRLAPFAEERRFQLIDRIKSVESIAEKMESGRFASFDAIDDYYAATVVVPTLAEDPEVLQYLDSEIQRVVVRGRSRTPKDPQTVRFDSTRFYGRLKPSLVERDERLDRLTFEVQIHTAFEHAWTVVTHDRVYKSDTVDWRASRLAALMKASVEQLDLLLVGFDRAVEQIAPSHWEEHENRVELLKTISQLVKAGRIPNELAPDAWGRFADNVFGLCSAEAHRRRVKAREVVRDLTSAVTRHCDVDGWRCPRSVSLFQLVFGIAAQEGVIKLPLSQYSIIVNQEMVQLFPVTAEQQK